MCPNHGQFCNVFTVKGCISFTSCCDLAAQANRRTTRQRKLVLQHIRTQSCTSADINVTITENFTNVLITFTGICQRNVYKIDLFRFCTV